MAHACNVYPKWRETIKPPQTPPFEKSFTHETFPSAPPPPPTFAMPSATLEALCAAHPTLPPAFLSTQLRTLSARYTRGLTQAIASDEVTKSWNKSRPISVFPTHYVATLRCLASQKPDIWAITMRTDGHGKGSENMALLFAHTSHIGIIPIGARFIFAPMSHSTARRVRGAARAAVKKAGKLRVCSPVGVQIETWDETKIRNVEVVYLPTLGMAFDILDAPITTPETQSMGLCDVWRNRTLEPEWVFAVVCEMDFGAREGRVRVRDGGKDGMAQPSVLWYVGQQFMFLKHVLTLGGSLLLKGLLVKPTGTSFDLISTERTVCYCELCGVTERASKRRRVHEPDYACQ